ANSDFVPHQMKWNELAAEAYRSSCDTAVEQLHREGVIPPFEIELKKSDGSGISVLMGSGRLDEEQDSHYVSYIIDISKQKAAEKRRAELQALIEKQKDDFHRIFLNAPAVISIRCGPDLVYEF